MTIEKIFFFLNMHLYFFIFVLNFLLIYFYTLNVLITNKIICAQSVIIFKFNLLT